VAARRAGHLVSASATRFSPKLRWPASMSGMIAAEFHVLLIATSSTSPRRRPARRAARVMAASTSASRVAAGVGELALL
jgi:hypothetical protein